MFEIWWVHQVFFAKCCCLPLPQDPNSWPNEGTMVVNIPIRRHHLPQIPLCWGTDPGYDPDDEEDFKVDDFRAEVNWGEIVWMDVLLYVHDGFDGWLLRFGYRPSDLWKCRCPVGWDPEAEKQQVLVVSLVVNIPLFASHLLDVSRWQVDMIEYRD